VVGGNSDAALRRAAAWGDGWYGFNLDGVVEVRTRITKLDELCAGLNRDRSELRLAVALRSPTVEDYEELAVLGIDELVLVESPPDGADAATRWVRELAEQWMKSR
jgi:alkanesulfonate monooxygenase SsuD/methylene tetrahydromethanopterin reductase-like flavin-dependent oxidoreductase (luciferase family)